MITHIIESGGYRISSSTIKKTELKLSHFFDWKIEKFTFYDFLEYFMLLGTLFDTDQLNKNVL